MSGVQSKKYQQLGLRDALCIPYRYPFACNELSLILQKAYHEVPKSMQSLIFEDVLAAFRLLPQMQMQSAVSAAHTLRNAADRILPKQKKVVAISEFKQAKIAHKRIAKAPLEDRGSGQLPQDILVLLFSLLDVQSLVLAGQVCRSWNEAANENLLWQSHYISYFVDLESSLIVEKPQANLSSKDRNHIHSFNWKHAFRQKYVGSLSKKFKCNRAYCAQCNLIVWLDGVKCPKHCFGKRAEDLHIVSTLAPGQIISYLINGSWMTSMNSHYSDTDSSDDEFGFWVNPKLFFEG